MSYFIFIHISPYLFHSDAWPLSHFLLETHICLVLLSIKKYLFLFWVMYYHLAEFCFCFFFPVTWENIHFMLPLFQDCWKYMYITCFGMAVGWLFKMYVVFGEIWMGRMKIVKDKEEELKTSAGSRSYAMVESAIQHTAIYAGQELWHFIYSLMDL